MVIGLTVVAYSMSDMEVVKVTATWLDFASLPSPRCITEKSADRRGRLFFSAT